jgi:hypothetical protein
MPEQELRISPRQHCPFLAELSSTSELATALFSLFGGKNQKFPGNAYEFFRFVSAKKEE